MRKASGLIRTAGTWDVLAYNINFTSIGLAVALPLPARAGLLPRRPSLPWATVICVIAILPLALVYGYLASAMPRSGGDYVYVSRVLGPALGHDEQLQHDHVVVLLRWGASAFLARYGLAPFFRTMGIYTGQLDAHSIGNWFASQGGHVHPRRLPDHRC